MGYGDYDDPDMYGNSAYGGGRYASNDEYGSRRNSFGGGAYGGYGNTNDRANSAITRSRWNGGSSYGGTTYGSTQSLAQRTATPKNNGGYAYGGVGKTPSVGGKDLSAFKTGVRVKHPKFGVSVLLAFNGKQAERIQSLYRRRY